MLSFFRLGEGHTAAVGSLNSSWRFHLRRVCAFVVSLYISSCGLARTAQGKESLWRLDTIFAYGFFILFIHVLGFLHNFSAIV